MSLLQKRDPQAKVGHTKDGSNITNNNSIRFSTDGYVINRANGFVLNIVPGGSAPIITVDAGLEATIDAPISGSNQTKRGAGTLILSGVNTYSGSTAINAGVLSISQDANLGTPPGAPITHLFLANGGTLQATASFTLNPNRGVTLNSGGGGFDVAGFNVLTYGGVITGGGNLTKNGAGTMTLAGANTYIGGTTISGGTILTQNASALRNRASGL